jgi:hypothetical protein
MFTSLGALKNAPTVTSIPIKSKKEKKSRKALMKKDISRHCA